jgi:drug/metabolite transporter (DMT)-like permease
MVWLGALLCSIAGYVISIIKKEQPNPISFKERLVLGGLFTANMVSTNYALLFISYPIQVIGRNIRFLFVVLIGAFFSRIKTGNNHLKLGKHKIFMALVITLGVLLFNFAKGVSIY